MASALTYFFNLILLSTFSIIINGENSGWYSATKVMDKMEEKVTNLHFYFHDTVSGDHASAIVIAGPKDTASFGTTRIVDDPLTEGPESTSKLIGKAQGVYSMAAQQDVSLLMVITCAFMEDKYNGSTLSVLGRNPVLQTVREMPIVGGTERRRDLKKKSRETTPREEEEEEERSREEEERSREEEEEEEKAREEE
ncbi:hypothetical protein IFM89_037951 [Coptis chinensis]|uniref:Dirigent protein n=1 Tax=Coptis chinensis TaxID=261450 RepID=A0A835LT17_9MAGN|nr:hypothetical protein IFM89_037951 [Coptis chinensis]